MHTHKVQGDEKFERNILGHLVPSWTELLELGNMHFSEFTLLSFASLFLLCGIRGLLVCVLSITATFLCTSVHCSPTIVLLSVSSPTFSSLFVFLHFLRLLSHTVSSRWPWRSSARIDKELGRNLRIRGSTREIKLLNVYPGILPGGATHSLNPAGQ